jgi:hypothetical protein
MQGGYKIYVGSTKHTGGPWVENLRDKMHHNEIPKYIIL